MPHLRLPAVIAPMPSGAFDIVVADPPWRSDFGLTSDRAHEKHYPTMSLAEIAGLRVPSAKDALLYLWATAPMLVQSLSVMEAWGFTYRTQLVWDKQVRGTGKWARNQHEIVLLGRRGRFPAPAPALLRSSVIGERRGRHSAKPEALQQMIEEQYPGRRYLELFARRARPGWTVWGNEAPGVAA